MSNKDTRREIEELRALVDQMSSARKRPLAAEQSTGNVSEPGGKVRPVADAKVEGRVDEANVPHEPPGVGSVFGSSTVIASWALISAVLLALLVVGREFLIPLAVALLLRTLLNSLAALFGRIKLGGSPFPKWLAWTCSLISLALANAFVYWILISQSEALLAAAPVYQANFAKLTENFATSIGIQAMPSTAQFMESLDLGAMLSWLGGWIGSILNEFILVAIYVGFLLVEQRHFTEKIVRLVSDEAKVAKTRALMNQISKQVETYMGIKTVVSLLTGIISYIVLRLVGVNFAAVWALIIFLLNYIPAVGSALGVVLPALLTLVQFETLAPFAMMVAGLGVTQFVIGNVVEPAMMGSTLKSKLVRYYRVSHLLGNDLGHCRHGFVRPHHGYRCDCLFALRASALDCNLVVRRRTD